jgi:tyrosine-protein kinase Etk/Wzc
MIFPKKYQNLIFAFILSLIIPLVIISVYDRLRSSFGSYDEVSKYSSRPLLGKILHTTKKTIKASSQESSPYLESLRLLRTNLDFFIRDSQRRVILVTSSIENEGKSFTAYNLAMSFALLKKSVVLVTFDLRKPSNYPGLSVENMIGITSYYIGKATMEDIIVHTEVERMDIIPAGKLPPNPAELIELERTKDIINQLKHRYDYIILDTPPIYYFTDTFLLMKHADINLLVIRHNVTNKNIFSRTIHSIEEKNIPNVALVYNDIPVESNYKYGYKYYQKKQVVKDRV